MAEPGRDLGLTAGPLVGQVVQGSGSVSRQKMDLATSWEQDRFNDHGDMWLGRCFLKRGTVSRPFWRGPEADLVTSSPGDVGVLP